MTPRAAARITLADFAGRWRLDRRIDDYGLGQVNAFAGEATLSRTGAGMRYFEAGTLTLWTGAQMRAERTYLWSTEADDIVVRFEDERPFHRFRPGGGERDAHLCGEDLYRVQYDFASWPNWTAIWRVTGPRKNYLSTTRHAPMQDAI